MGVDEMKVACEPSIEYKTRLSLFWLAISK